MKRSNEPIFWALFGAGGMLAALFGPALVFITGVAVPLGWIAPETMNYQHMLGFVHNWLGKIIAFAVVTLFSWHAAHRIHILLHDFGVHARTMVRLFSYGLAFVATVIAAYTLLTIGG